MISLHDFMNFTNHITKLLAIKQMEFCTHKAALCMIIYIVIYDNNIT